MIEPNYDVKWCYCEVGGWKNIGDAEEALVGFGVGYGDGGGGVFFLGGFWIDKKKYYFAKILSK